MPWYEQFYLNEFTGEGGQTKLIIYSVCAGIIVLCFLCSIALGFKACCCPSPQEDNKVHTLGPGYGRTSIVDEADAGSGADSNHDMYSDSGKPSPMVGPGVKKNAIMPFALDSIESDKMQQPRVIKQSKKDTDLANQR